MPQETSARVCNLCHRELVILEDDGAALIQGDANAIHSLNSNSHNTTVHTTDSNNTSNSHNTSIGSISSGNVTNNNTTIIVDNATIGKLSLEEKMREYRSFCEANINNGIITNTVRNRLDAKADELNLGKDNCRLIEISIRERSGRASYVFSEFDRSTLQNVSATVRANANLGDLQKCISKLTSLAAKCDEEDVHYFLNLLRAVTDPSQQIRYYKDRTTDSYWQTFWTYIAYLKNDNIEQAENVIQSLSCWNEYYSQDNIRLLFCCGELFTENCSDIVAQNIRETFSSCTSYSRQLEGLYSAIKYLLQVGSSGRKLSQNPEIDFYLSCIWGIKPQSNKSVGYGGENYSAVAKVVEYDNAGFRKDVLNVVAPKGPTQIPNNSQQTKSTKRSNGKISIVCIVCVIIGAAFLYFRSGDDDKSSSKSAVATKSSTEQSKQTTTTAVTTKVKSTAPKSKAKPSSNTKPSATKATKQTTTVTSSKPKTEPNSATSVQRTTTKVVTDAPKPKVEVPATPSPATQSTPEVVRASVSPETMSVREALDKGRNSLNNGDYSRAALCFRHAADKGSAEAQYEYAVLVKNGSGVAKNNYSAFYYMKKAAEGGYSKAYRELGEMYHGGRGTTKDRAQAEYWYRKAVNVGDQRALRILNNM